MKTQYLLDSVILIDHLNGIKQASKWLASLKNNEAAISIITFTEILTGENNSTKLYNFLDEFICYYISKQTAQLAAELRRTNRWKLPDALQAAIAIENSLTLVTRNTKDFSPKKHSFIEIPYKINN